MTKTVSEAAYEAFANWYGQVNAQLETLERDLLLQAFAQHAEQARLEERERCARIAEGAWVPSYVRCTNGEWEPGSPYDRGAVDALTRIATAIRKGEAE